MSNSNGGVFTFGIQEDDEVAVGLEDGFGAEDFQPDCHVRVELEFPAEFVTGTNFTDASRPPE